MADERTPYPLPPLAEVGARLPDEVPWDTPIADLAAFWIEARCACGENAYLPLRLLAARVGWKRTLRTVMPRLRCSACGGRPSEVWLCENAASKDSPRHALC